MNWTASWIWHPPTDDPDNFYLYARKALALDGPPKAARLAITAVSLYKLYVNGCYVGRGPNPADPSFYYYDVHDVAGFLQPGENVVAVLAYNYGPETRGVLGQNCGRSGLLAELRAPDEAGNVLLATDETWRVLQSPAWRQDMPLNCTLYGDFKEYYDSRLEPEGWMAPGFDDADWLEPEVLGRPPVEPRTRLIEREIPFLGGERVRPVRAYWESASVTYAWRDDWEVYDDQKLVPGSREARPDHVTRIQKTHDDFDPSLILDFGRDVTGYPEIAIHDSAGGVFDVLYGEDLFLTRVDTFVLRGGPQTLQPFNRRTFRYMKLLFRETPEPVQIADVSMEMDTYPVEFVGSFECSDPLLNRIWDVGRHTIRMSMLDHFIDCPWRERTIYGGDIYPENAIAWYAFGDGRLARKTLRQMAAIQHDDGPLPPFGPYSGCTGFYPSWSAYWGLTLLDYYEFTGDYALLEELWPNLQALLKWALERIDPEVGLIGEPGGRPSRTPDEPNPYVRWMNTERDRYLGWTNFPFRALFERAVATAEEFGDEAAAARYAAAAGAMDGGLVRTLVDEASGCCATQADSALLVWSGVARGPEADRAATGMFSEPVQRINTPFHGFFVLDALFGNGRNDLAIAFMREYWGDMLDRGATTFWEHFSLDWPAGADAGRGTSLCHGWSAAPTWALPAWVLGVRPAAPGFAEVLIEPHPCDLAWAKGDVPTPQGVIRIEWTREDGAFRMELIVPEGCAARLSLPTEGASTRATIDGRDVETQPESGRMVLGIGPGRHEVLVGR